MRIRRVVFGLIAAVCSAATVVVVPSGTVTAAGPPAQLPTANPANFTPNVMNGEVDSIWQVGNRTIIGGTFTSVANTAANGGATFARSRIAAFNATTGAVDTAFAPVVNGKVTTVLPAADGTSIFIGGNFSTVNGVTRNRVARINLANGSLVTAFNAGSISGNVRDMRLVADQLYIGGGFTSVAGQSRTRLASLNPATGAVTSKVNLAFAGTQNGGTTQVFKMDATPAGDRLLVIGNFAQVAGQNRRQIAMIDLSTTPATLHSWQTDFYTSTCASVFDAYIRDLDISQDGSFAIVSTTGAYRANTSCDTIARFEVYTTQAGLAPSWIDYTGGDTSYAVEVRGGVVFVGGHQRWFNNPFGRDAPGAGAIPREGIAALDVTNGLPFSWNPGRTRGVGVFDFHITDAGVWAGSDTDVWGGETHRKLAFFPWAGGSMVPENLIAELPGEVYLLGRTTGTPTEQDEVRHRSYTGVGAPGATNTVAGTVQWRNVRGSFQVNSTLYTINADGTFQRRSFDGTFGTPTTVNLFQNNIIADAPNISGVFYDPNTSRIYYTMSGNTSLFFRYFTPESNVIGATRFTATGAIAALTPARVRGMFLSGNTLYFADNNNGNLLRIGFVGGAVSGTATVADATVDWRGRAMFLDGDSFPVPSNVPPTAAFTPQCELLDCTFDSSASGDSDGFIANYAWTFGDGEVGSGANATHTYDAPGTYTVGLTVTDDDGIPTSTSQSVTISGPGNAAPVAAFTSSCTLLECTFDGSGSDDSDGTIEDYAWTFGDGAPVSGSSPTAAHTYPVAGTYPVTLTVTDDAGDTNVSTGSVTVGATPATVAFRAAAGSSGSGVNASVGIPAAVQPGDQLLYFVTANVAAAIEAPDGWTMLGTQTDGGPDMQSWVFTRTAVAGTGGSTVTAMMTTAGTKTTRLVVAYAGAGVPTALASSVVGASSTNLTSPAVPVAVSGSVVVNHWSDKSATASGWTLPASVTQRAAAVGTGSGRITAAVGDAVVTGNNWPGATATTSVAGTKGIAWSVVVGPV